MTSTLIQLFAKPPVPGRVKTRLIPALGAKAATEVYRYCLSHNLNLLQHWANAHDGHFQLWLSEPGDDDLFNHLTPRYQQGKDIGERMFHALASELHRDNRDHEQVILIGSDCLDLDNKLFDEVSHQLQHYDVVIVPALDGGYVLIGASNRIDSRLFDCIDWSTERVLQQTLDQAKINGVSVHLMNPLRDIDHVEDLQHYPALTQYL